MTVDNQQLTVNDQLQTLFSSLPQHLCMPLQRIARSQGAQLTRSALGLISAVSVLGSTFYSFATYGQTFEKFDGDSDPLAQSQLAKAFNPYGNRTLSDIYVAHVPLRQIDSDLVRNNNENSSALVERYVAGTIGGWGKYSTMTLPSLTDRKLNFHSQHMLHNAAYPHGRHLPQMSQNRSNCILKYR